MLRGPKRSAGICQSYNDFDLLDTRGYQARTSGLKGNELNFTLLKQGDLMRGSELQYSVDRTHEHSPHNSNGRRGPDAPHPRQKLRDDLELQAAMRARPRPF